MHLDLSKFPSMFHWPDRWQGRKKTRSDCPAQVNFALGQVTVEVWLSSGQVKLASVVLLVIISNKIKSNYQVNDVIDEAWTLCTYWPSNILVGATENRNALAHWTSGFQFFFLPWMVIELCINKNILYQFRGITRWQTLRRYWVLLPFTLLEKHQHLLLSCKAAVEYLSSKILSFHSWIIKLTRCSLCYGMKNLTLFKNM